MQNDENRQRIKELVIQASNLAEILLSNELDSVNNIYGLLQDESANIDEKIFQLEDLLRIFDESKYIRKTDPITIPDTMGIRSIDLSPVKGESEDEPITLKVSGFAIRAISITLTALKSLPKNNGTNNKDIKGKESELIKALVDYHKELENPKVLSNFMMVKNKDSQEKASRLAHNGLYNFINKQARNIGHPVAADPWYKRINFSKLEFKTKEENEVKKQRKALMSSDDCQLLTRPKVHATVTSNDITIKQTFTPVTHMTEKQKEAWKQVAKINSLSNADIKQQDSENSTKLIELCESLKQNNNHKEAKELKKLYNNKQNFNTFKTAALKSDTISKETKEKITSHITNIEPSWFKNFPEQFRQEYITMAKDAVELEKLLEEVKSSDQYWPKDTPIIAIKSHQMNDFKDKVKDSTISLRMKSRIARDLQSVKAFEEFNPFFVLAQSASSGNRCSPQASNLVAVETVIVKNNKIISKDTSYTRSNENMLADDRYNKDSNYAPEGKDRSPFWDWQLGSAGKVMAQLFQSTPDPEDEESLVDCAVMTLEQIYHNHIVDVNDSDSDKENKTKQLTESLQEKYAKHWGFNEKNNKEFTISRTKKGNGKKVDIEFKYKPILFSSSLLSTLPGPIENSFITRKEPDRNRMMFFQKLAAFDKLKESGQVQGKMITMNFAVNDYRKQALMGFGNVIDKHNRHEAAELTLAVLNNLIVATHNTRKTITPALFEIHDKIENAVKKGNRKDLDKVSKQLIAKLEAVSTKLEGKQYEKGKAADNAKIAVAATTEFIRLFQKRHTPKSANEQMMLACYANIMVQSSSGEASQTDQHCKSGRDRTYTTQIYEKAMQRYFAEYGKIPTADDDGKSLRDSKGNPVFESTFDTKTQLDARERFIEIYAELFFTGLGQENSNQNQHGSFGLQNISLRRKWPLCLVFGTVSPDATCMLPKDIQDKLKERDHELKNNNNLRNLGKMSKEMKEKENAFIKATKTSVIFTRQLLMSPLAAVGLTILTIITPIALLSKIMPKVISKNEIFKNFMAASTSIGLNLLSLLKPVILLALSPLVLLAPPFLLCCKITGEANPRYNPLLTGTLLFAAIAVTAFYLAPVVIASAAVVQVAVSLAVGLTYMFGAQCLDPDKSVQDRSLDMSATIMLAAAITSIILFSPAISLALPVIAMPIVAAIAAIPLYNLTQKVAAKAYKLSTPQELDKMGNTSKISTKQLDKELWHGNNFYTEIKPLFSRDMSIDSSNHSDSTERNSDISIGSSNHSDSTERNSDDNSKGPPTLSVSLT